MKFNELKINNKLLASLSEMGFEEPTPIQQQAIPLALEGNDLIGQAQTGTGKTAAFGIPMLNKLDNNLDGIQGLVVAPTRELAIQVQDELFRLGKGQRARVYVVYGGAPIGQQIERIKRNKPQIIVGTPGRILDLIRRGVLRLSELQTLVLDEADEMLNMGFYEDVFEIIENTPSTRQTMLFSATMPPAIRQLSNKILKDPKHVKIEAKEMTADLIDQYFVKCRDDEKFDILTRLIDVQAPTQAIIFCRTKKRVDEVGRGLNLRGYNTELIHGDITQQKRTSVINQFRQNQIEILVATDVAARGLDISGVTHVYNYDIPQDPESYVHRIGRTGRAGNEGMSTTFVTNNEMPYLRTIETLIRKQMTPLRPPTDQEAKQGQVQQIVDQLNEKIDNHQADDLMNVAKQMLEHYDATELVAALLSEVIVTNNDVAVTISPQKPLPNADRKENKRRSASNSSSQRSRNNRSGDGGGGNRNYNSRSKNQSNKSAKAGKGSNPRQSNTKTKNFKVRQKGRG
ncbi:DEAD/DEAH box helicase [Fundicoccus culcitae]|uniref:DEAD/DEAH box helicase n=1 Tax=Fundicoccus culcitae TaxID=2969821 RepID=A0ABY5P4C2_9LACT|nr:DEAD/DEAH box helicase [Fundicoccus culcitae]UUX33225.1 DEAD/DEAH box helicase [Fundicoccus culcitae]